jgi:hypothetical protein
MAVMEYPRGRQLNRGELELSPAKESARNPSAIITQPASHETERPSPIE